MSLGRERTTDVVAGLLIALFSAWVWWTAETTIPRGMRTDPLGPAAVPQLIAIATGVGGLLLALSRVLPNPWLKPVSVGEDESFTEESGGTFSWTRLIGVVAASAIYVAVFESVGYLITTPLYGLAILLLMGVRKPVNLAVAVLGVTAVLFAGFQLGLGIPLPSGPLGGV